MKKLLPILIVLTSNALADDGYSCRQETINSPIAYVEEDGAWVEANHTDSKTLRSIVIVFPKMYEGLPFVNAELKNNNKTRFIIPLKTYPYSHGMFENIENENKYEYSHVVADKEFFNGSYCIVADYTHYETKKNDKGQDEVVSESYKSKTVTVKLILKNAIKKENMLKAMNNAK